MLILKQAGERNGARVVVLGTFDGVHLGHQELIRRGRIVSQSAGIPLRVCTFDRHPLAVIRPGKQPPLLTTLAEKAERMDACGVDELRVLSFDQRMADTPPGDFLRLLREEQEIRAIVAGWNYTFGSKGAGTADRLLRAGEAGLAEAARSHDAPAVPIVDVVDEDPEVTLVTFASANLA